MRHKCSFVILVLGLCACVAAQNARTDTCELYRHAPEPPYVLRFSSLSGGTLTYVGVAHTTDINSRSIAEIERQWKQNHPTAAFSEGGVWPLADSREIAVSKYGEGGLLRFFAAHGNVPIQSLEPPAAEEPLRCCAISAPSD